MAMFQFLDRLFAGPIGPAIGTQQAIEMINLAGRTAGWPKDFRLRDASPAVTPEQQAEQIKGQISQYLAEVEAKVLSEVKAGITPIMEHDKKQDEAIAHISQIIEAAEAHRPPPMGGPGQVMPPGAMPNGMPV